MKIGDSVYVHGYIDEIRKDCVIICNDGGYFGTDSSEVINSNLIRCKDCKYHFLHKRLNIPWCRYFHIDRGYDDFCSSGERKE